MIADSHDRPPRTRIGPLADGRTVGSRPVLLYGTLCVLWLLHCAANLWWLARDTRPPYFDMAGHAQAALEVASFPYLSDPLDAARRLLEIEPYPPVTYLASTPWAAMFGPGIDLFIAANGLFLALLILSTYEIGRRVAGPTSGLLAAVLVSLYPVVYGLSRHYLLDMPLTAMVTAANGCVLWSEGFRRRLPSVALGVALGLAALTKWTFLVFVAGPLLVATIRGWREDRLRARGRNLLLAGAVTLLIAAPWYLSNAGRLGDFLQIGGFLVTAPEVGVTPGWTQPSWRFYGRQILEHQLLLPLTLALLVGSCVALRRRRNRDADLLLLSWIVPPVIAFTLYAIKDLRYTMPLLPALAIVTGEGLAGIGRVSLRRAVVTTVLLWSLIQFAGLTFGLSHRLAAAGLRIRSRIEYKPMGVPLTLYAENIHIATPPRVEDWPLATILRDVVDDARRRPDPVLPVRLAVVSEALYFEPQAFLFEAELARAPIVPYSIQDLAANELEVWWSKADYLVAKSGDQGPDWRAQGAARRTEQLATPSSAVASQFELLSEYPLPDGSQARLYRRRP